MSYVQEVANVFLARCGSITVLGPTDFATIAEWEKQEIPLALIVSSINEGYDQLNGRGTGAGSVADIQEKVKNDFLVWLQGTHAAAAAGQP